MEALIKKQIPVNLWLILFSIILLIGILSTASSFLYFLDTENPVGYFDLLQTRILSYLLWFLFIPLVYFLTILFLKDKPLIISILSLIAVGVMISLLHRIIVLYLNNQFLAESPSQEFFSDLLNEKFAVLSLVYESFFLYTLLVIIIVIYKYYFVSQEARLNESKYRNELVNAEMSNLKMKFQPHFIFNALHSISAMIYKEPSKADSMITKLSELLRHAIKTGDNKLVLLSEELQIANRYMEIQTLRFGDRIKYVQQIDDNVLNKEVPLFILQPLLENCIKHAVELTNEQVNIVNKIKIVENNLFIEIKNNIPYNTEGKVNSLGEGLGNLRARLNYLYQDNYSFTSDRNLNNEFEVRLEIPCK